MGELSETTTTQPEDAKAPPAAAQASPAPPPEAESQPNDNPSSARSSPLPKSKCHCAGTKSALARSDVMIRRLDQFISTAYGQERLLAMVQYNSQIIHYFLLSPPLRSTFARLRSILLPANPGAGVAKPPPPPPQQQQTPPLLALSALMSETRTTLRLLGLLSLWSWGSATLRNPPADPLLRTVAYAQVAVNVAYQVLENVAHLAGKGVVSRRAVERWGSLGRWWVWSTRAWLGHVLLEFVRVWREYVLAWDRRKGFVSEDGKKIGEAEREREMEVRGWKKSIVNSLAWLPLCVHWSFEDGVGVPEKMVGVLSMTACAWGVYDMWNATAGVI
ncbi:peroxin 11C [Blastomyces dermatitidis ER-3]|uniref:Peroxin 11C n=1 Tax=Ajellomyces dermatitidis (strain ER-3 / ATCC MYA-2586) TaxID=559297 RepID=A0ABP2EZY2_AJEDR|nr:peroxin 11C [Blastomyces dermatitidis ER-3]EEQ89890.1 peroxin 11C [Blastomyces dermatitidis ER-3]